MDGEHPDERQGDSPAARGGTAERQRAAALAVLVVIVLPFLLPQRLTAGPRWVLPLLEALFLVAVLLADPGRIDRNSPSIRALSIALVVVIVTGAAWGTARLVWELLHGDPQFATAGRLLVTGALVWVDTIIAFTFVYWELDGGGPWKRFFRPRRYPDFAFPEQMNPDLAPPGWHPVLVDYLYLAITNAMAFSPTDVMPLARWAKLTMAAQSLISIIILSLVIANAVNILGD